MEGLSQNFRAVGQPYIELHILKVQKLDACTRPLFTYTVIALHVHDYVHVWYITHAVV